jgi:hypothetical protein
MINVRTSACKAPVCLVWFNRTWIFEQVFEWSSNIKLQEKSYQWKLGCWVQDKHEANSRFSQRVVYHLGYLPISLKYKVKSVSCEKFWKDCSSDKEH